jgi:hypothetical protein
MDEIATYSAKAFFQPKHKKPLVKTRGYSNYAHFI